jgi:Mg-chelatase subunit ChlD
MTRQDFRAFVHPQGLRWWLPVLLLAAAVFAGPVRADVELRIERPISNPIQALVTVTDENGDPILGFATSDFTVTLDNELIPTSDLNLTPPDAAQRVSVVFVMDYSSSVQSTARPAMEAAVTNFISTMSSGDYAAIIKFNNTNGATLVWPFTQIGVGSGTNDLITAVGTDYPGSGTPLLDAINLAINHFIATLSTLPAGPKAIIAITDGGENSSTVTQSSVIDNASGNSIPVFTIGVGEITSESRLALLTNLPIQTGGEYLPAPDDDAIAAAYVTVSLLLNNQFLLSIPSSISGCGLHTLQVAVAGQAMPASETFSRCDTTPDPFSFPNKTGVARSAVVTSDAVTISSIDGPAVIVVSAGEYSIGCGGIFTSASGTINNGQTVCVRHTASSAYSTEQMTTLTVGGVTATFRSTTAAKPPPNGGGGGGAMGVVELLAGLVALAARRRRAVAN